MMSRSLSSFTPSNLILRSSSKALICGGRPFSSITVVPPPCRPRRPLLSFPRALLLVEGEDAAHFLEGLITSDLPQAGEARGSALLTPQGKLLFSFLVSRYEDGFVLECDASEITDLTNA